MQKARRHCQKAAPTACRRMVSGSVALPCSGFFSPFPHGTGPLSVSYEYLALPDGPGGFTQDSSCPALLRIPLRFMSLRVRVFHALWRNFPEPSTHDTSCDIAVLLPRQGRNPVWAAPRSLATTWGITNLFSFPPGTKMFQFPGLAPLCGGWSSTSRVVPFGDPRVKGHLHLTAAFRSLSRPSSPVRAKASAIRPFLLSFARHLPDPAASLQQCCSIADAGRRLVYFRLSL